MNLEIRRTDDRTMVLTDDAGRALPGQVGVAWSHGGPGSLAEITVRFHVDGNTIRLADGPPTGPKGSLPEASAAYAALSDDNRARFRTMFGLKDSSLSPEVIELVVAAREVAFTDAGREAFERLDKASEAFASAIPWDDEP